MKARIALLVLLLAFVLPFAAHRALAGFGTAGGNIGSGSVVNPGSLTAPAGSAGTIAQYSVNGVINVQSPAYGAVSSIVNTTATCATGVATCTLAAAGDFLNGQAVVIAHGGANPSLTAPTLAVASDLWTNPYTAGADGASNNAACYAAEALDGKGGKSAASATVCITNSQATLSPSLFNRVTWTHIASATAYKIYSCIVANPAVSCTPTFGSAGVSGAVITDIGAAGTQTWDDTGNSVTGHNAYWGVDPIDGNTANGPQNDNLNTTILSGAGTTSITLATNIVNASGVTSVWFAHDNVPAFNAATTAICTNGGELYIPAGSYEMGQQWLINRCSGLMVHGAGTSFIASTTTGSSLINAGALGMIGIYVDATRNSKFSNFAVLGANLAFATYGVALNIDDDTNTGSHLTTNNSYADLILDEAGAGIDIANLSSINTDLQTFTNVQMLRRGQYFAYIGPGTNAVLEDFYHCSDNGTQYGYFVKTAQLSHVFGNTFNNNIAVWLQAAARATTIESSTCEHCSRALVRTGTPGQAATLINDTFIPLQVMTDGFGIGTQGSAVTLIGNDFSVGQSAVNWNVFAPDVFGGASSVAVVAINNIFPNATPFASIGKGGGPIMIGNTALVAGANVPIGHTISGATSVQSNAVGTVPFTVTTGGNAPTADLLDTNINGTATLAFVDKGGHWSQGAVAVPTITAGTNCTGAGASVTGSDNDAIVTTSSGGAATTCTMTFNKAFANAPSCGCSAHNAAAAAVAQCWAGTEAVGSVIITFGSVTSGAFHVQCSGH